jgi:hypothetical protein
METHGVTEDSTESAGPAKRSSRRRIIIFVAATIINVGLLAVLVFVLLTPAVKPSGSHSNALRECKKRVAYAAAEARCESIRLLAESLIKASNSTR